MNDQFAVAVHGGAGKYHGITEEHQAVMREAVRESLQIAAKILEQGGSSLDAVQAAVMVLEDHNLFNAGKGSVFASDGRHYMDASIMTGIKTDSDKPRETQRSGAVAAVGTVKNPIQLARSVMENSPHVLLVGEHAENFAAEQGFPSLDNAYFSTDIRREQLRVLQEAGVITLDHDSDQGSTKGTVGAVACDVNGHLASATSTGGTANKYPGRVGDSAIVGAGTYAEDDVCAVSATGWGETFLENYVGARIASLIRDAGYSFMDAVEKVVHKVLPKGSGGVIAVNSDAEISMPFTTDGMARGSIRSGKEPKVDI